MTIKEAFDIIARYVPICFKDELETIEKDLKVLETLKKHSSIIEIYSNVDKLGERFVCEISFNDKQDVEKLKEWLKNE